MIVRGYSPKGNARDFGLYPWGKEYLRLVVGETVVIVGRDSLVEALEISQEIGPFMKNDKSLPIYQPTNQQEA